MRVLVILTMLIASPVMAGIFSDYDAAQRKAQLQEKIDLMKSVNAQATYNLQLENETQKRLNELNLREMEYQQRQLNENK